MVGDDVGASCTYTSRERKDKVAPLHRMHHTLLAYHTRQHDDHIPPSYILRIGPSPFHLTSVAAF